MFGCLPLNSWQSRLPLRLCNDRTDIVLSDVVGLNSDTEGRRRILVLSLFGRTFFLQVIEYTGYWLEQFKNS